MLSDQKLLKLDALCEVLSRIRVDEARVFSDETIAGIRKAVSEGQRAGKLKIERELRQTSLTGDLMKSLVHGFEDLLETRLKVPTDGDSATPHHQSAWSTNMDAVGYDDI